MHSLGYIQAKYNASLYWHPEKGIQVLVHGDDFVAVSDRAAVGEFQTQIAKRFTVKTKVIGPEERLGDLREARVLNRLIRCGQQGWEYEPDQRHAELIVKSLGMEKAKPVKTPGEDEPQWKWKPMRKFWGQQRHLPTERWPPEPTTWQPTEPTSSMQLKSAAEGWPVR